MKRLHPLDMESDACCWTCNKPFAKRQMLYQHFSTVQHQINCRKLQQGEIPEIEENSIETQHSTRNTENKEKSAYRRRLFERPIRMHLYVRKPVSTLRSSPAIIPLEATMPQADPRTDPKVIFLDLIEIEIEIEDTMKIIGDPLKEDKTDVELKIEVRRTPPRRECEDNTETTKIQKQNTSRSEILPTQSETALSEDPDIDTAKECSLNISYCFLLYLTHFGHYSNFTNKAVPIPKLLKICISLVIPIICILKPNFHI